MSSEGVRIAVKSGDDVVPAEMKPTGAAEIKYELPPRYREGISSFMEKAQNLDSEYKHRWVHISPRNQTV